MAFRPRGEVGARIAERLDRLGYRTVVDGAEHLGVSRGTLSRWLHGHVAEIDAANRLLLADRLGGDPDDYRAVSVTPVPLESALLLDERYAEAIAAVAAQRELIEQVLRELRRIEAGLALSGIDLPVDVALPSVP